MADSTFDGREQLDEEDFDLLTYTEAGTRLDQEIAWQRRRLAAFGAHSAREEREECENRIAALEEARERHTTRSITAENAEGFFGSTPKSTPR